MKALKKSIAMLITVCLCAGLLASCKNVGKDNGASPSPQATSSTETSSAIDKPTASTEVDVSKFQDLKVTVIGKIQDGNKLPTKDVLTPIWREKTKVIPEIIEVPGNVNQDQWLQMQILANTLPDIIAPSNGIFDNEKTAQILLKNKVLREITADDIKKYMPRTVKRLNSLGVTVEDWLTANINLIDMKNWTIPSFPSLGINPENRKMRAITENMSVYSYGMYFRDDILKKIFPQARTEEEFKKLYVEKGGNLSREEIVDVPLNNPEELYVYLKKVKELGIKVNGQDIIPAHPFLTNGDSASSFMWSMFSFPGFWWQDNGDRLTTDTSMTYFAATPEWKEYMHWMNRAYNEDLLGKDIFIQKDNQRDAKVKNGMYAVFQNWLDVNSAKAEAKKRGETYGYRDIPIFMLDLKNKYQDHTQTSFSLGSSWAAVGITKSITDEELAQVYNWIDWQFSEEAQELRAWGTPDFYIGEGENRRFKPEYKELEAWSLGGTENEKDGPYYGLYEVGNDVSINWETMGIGSYSEYLYAPKYVYPYQSENLDIATITRNAERKFYLPQLEVSVEKLLGDDCREAKKEFDGYVEEFSKMKSSVSWDAVPARQSVIKAIVGKPENFEKNYSVFETKYLPKEFLDNIKKQESAWIKYRELRRKYIEVIK